MTRIAACIAVALLALTAIVSAQAAEEPTPAQSAFGSMYSEAELFSEAIAREDHSVKRTLPVTGITVPHHLLAADLMARGFWAAHGNRYDRVIILSPDHFNRSRRPLATSQRNFHTVFGTIENDRAASGLLLEKPEIFDDSDLFEREHGVAALLPFVKWFFPGAKVVPIVVSISATSDDWEAAADAIGALLGPRTLIAQSTDYSHYLPVAAAIQRDQETLNIIAANDLGALTRLIQPDHLDSKGSQYIQMRLQARQGSGATVIANRNSSEYSPLGVRITTSYIVAVYMNGDSAVSAPAHPDQHVVYFGGDAYLGRFLTQPLADPEIAEEIIAAVRTRTGGAPLILNLEGALLDDPPEGLGTHLHVMHAPLAIPILQRLNTRAVSLANNHSFDLGANGLRETVAILRRSGIKPLLHGESNDLGRLRVIALNFVDGGSRAGYPVVRGRDLDKVCRLAARPPLVAFVHWGREYTNAATDAQYAAAQSLAQCGVGVIVGAHSHQASARIEAMQGGEYLLVYSLGNFLFDQNAARGSGALLEVRMFKQGTYATRLVPLPNLFDLGNERLRRR